MHVVGQIAGGEYSRHVCPARRVDAHAIVKRHSAAFEESDRRSDAHRHDGEIALQPAPIPRHRLFDLPGTFESDDLIAGHQFDARLPMDSGHELSHFGAQD